MQKTPPVTNHNDRVVVIMKCANSCNYNCLYCYNNVIPKTKGYKTNELMPLDVALSAITKICTHFEKQDIHLIWHGGEPLLNGIQYFEEILLYCKKEFFTRNIKHSIQTNASLLTEEIIKVLYDNKISIGLSLDGPEELHNTCRWDKNGIGTYKKTIEKLELIRKIGQKSSCICVLNKKNIGSIPKLYTFMRENLIDFKVNPVIYLKGATKAYNELSISPAEYGNVMCKLFDLWFDDTESPIRIYPFYSIISSFISGNNVSDCSYKSGCLKFILSIDVGGDIYPCGRLVGCEEFRLGNILTDSLSDVYDSNLAKKITSRDASTIKECSACRFAPYCNGGCMCQAYARKKKILDKDYYCESRKIYFSHIEDRVNKHLISLKQ